MSKHNKHTTVEVVEPSVPKASEGSVKSEAPVVEETKVEEPKKEVHRCDACKHYDVSTQRDFHRDGIKAGLCEVRAVCKALKEHTKAANHLVKNDSDRPCFDAGVYVVPVKGKKTKKEHPAEKKTETQQKSATQTVESKERPPEQKGSRKKEQLSAPRAMLKGCKA